MINHENGREVAGKICCVCFSLECLTPTLHSIWRLHRCTAKPLGWGDSGKFVFVRYALRLDDACYIYTHCTYMCKNMYYTVYAGLATLSFCFDKLFASALNMFLWHHLAKALISFENPFLRKGGPWREHSPLRIYIHILYIYYLCYNI